MPRNSFDPPDSGSAYSRAYPPPEALPPPPIRPVTQAKYRSIVAQLSARVFAQASPDGPTRFELMLSDLADRSDLKRSTQITYRAALLYEARKAAAEAPRDSAEHAAYAAVAEQIAAYQPPPDQHGKRRRKGIPELDLELLKADLKMDWLADSEVCGGAYLWLVATVAAGLRPSEWEQARWADAGNLFAVNAKVKMSSPAFNRGHGQQGAASTHNSTGKATRVIPLADSPDVEAVCDHMSRYERVVRPRLESGEPDPEAGQRHQAYYHSVRAAILRACKRRWGEPRYSLYSARQQFNANCRAALGRERTAVLMGHASADSPSAAHYASAAYADARSKAARAFRPSMQVRIVQGDWPPVGKPSSDLAQENGYEQETVGGNEFGPAENVGGREVGYGQEIDRGQKVGSEQETGSGQDLKAEQDLGIWIDEDTNADQDGEAYGADRPSN